MKVVALNLTNTKIGVALFDGILLKDYQVVLLNEYLLERHLNEVYNNIEHIIEKTKCDMIVMELLDLNKNGQENLSVESQVRGVIKLACERKGVVYQEYRVVGYFKKITGGKNTLSKKVRLLKENDIDIIVDRDNELNDNTILVDAILLGEGVAMGKLQISE